MTVRAGKGDDDSDRVTAIWPDGEIRNTWLQVTVKATAATGLAADDVFYYGNAVGETGDAPTANGFVNSTDRTRMLNNPKTFLSRATVENLHDANRDSLVNSTDRTIALNNATTFVTDLNLFTVPDTVSEGSASAGGSRLVYRPQQTLIDAVFGSVDDERGLLFDI